MLKHLKQSLDVYKRQEWEDYEKYDAIFLDIEMKKMSGIELSNIIRKKNKTVNLVFVTGEFKYALHVYKVCLLYTSINIKYKSYCKDERR